MADNRKMTFAEFWPYYVAEHSCPATRAVHLAGTLSYLAVLVGALLTRTWWLLALTPVVGYGFAWFSHFFIERNRPATFRYPLLSLLADHKMAFYILTGRMAEELERLGVSPRP